MPIKISSNAYAANNYFYIGETLYKALQAIRASDSLIAWNYDEGGVEEFVLSDARKKADPAFTTKAVGEMIERSPTTIRFAYLGHEQMPPQIPAPTKVYPMDGKNTPSMWSMRYWSKQDVYNLHDYFLSKHGGNNLDSMRVARQRKGLLSRAELRAKMENDTVYYIKNKDGEMIRVYGATE